MDPGNVLGRGSMDAEPGEKPLFAGNIISPQKGGVNPLYAQSGTTSTFQSNSNPLGGNAPGSSAPQMSSKGSNASSHGRRRPSSFFREAQETNAAPKSSLTDLDISRAAVFIQDAKHARDPEHEISAESLRTYNFFYGKLYRFHHAFVIAQIFCLGFFERSCRKDNCSTVDANQHAVRVWELLLLGFLLFHTFLRARVYGKRNVLKDPFEYCQLVFISLTVLDVIITWVLEGSGVGYSLRVTRPFRALFIINASSLMKNAFRQVIKTLPDVIDVMFIAIFFFLLWTTVCLVVFLQAETQDEHDIYFPNFVDGAWNLLVCWTTANFPDVMVPAYNVSRWYSLFFIIFLIVNLFIFMSLTLAVIYNSYRTHLREAVLHTHLSKRKALRKAFDIMKEINSHFPVGHEEREIVTIVNFYHVLKVLRPWYSDEKIRFIFDILDDGEDGCLNIREFSNITQLLNLQLSQENADSVHVLERWFPGFYRNNVISRAIKAFVNHPWFDPLIDLLIIANFVQLAEHAGRASSMASLNNEVDDVFIAIFQLEIILKLYCVPFSQWWSSNFNKFDLISVELSFLGNIFSATGMISGWIYTSFMLLRVFRLLRLLGRIERTRTIVGTLFRIIPVLRTFAVIQLSVFVFFNFIGMSLFGGGVTQNTVSPSTVWYQSSYFHNTFNTYAEGLIVCFELMVVNNWQIVVEGFVDVYGRSARIFFGVFYFLAVVLMLNIVVAFVIEAFTAEYDMNHKDQPEHIVNVRLGRIAEKAQKRRDKDEGEFQHAGKPMTVNAKWVARRKRKLNELMWYLFSSELQDRVGDD